MPKAVPLAREKALYETLVETLAEQLPAELQDSAAALAELDVLTNLAERADSLDYCRTKVQTEDASDCNITQGGRHPVVERCTG